jgi:hypothetical protein
MVKLYDRLVDTLCRALCVVLWWRFRVIPQARNPKEPLLRQLLLWKSKSLEVYLQHFDNPEPNTHMHCHEWPSMRSFVLSGAFVEERPRDGYIEHKRLTTYAMDASVWHRSHAWGPHCWTLFVCMGGRVIARGYRAVSVDYPSGQLHLGHFIPWRDHILQKIPSLTGIKTP